MKRTRDIARLLPLAGALLLLPFVARGQSDAPTAEAQAEYSLGKQAMDQARWAEAADRFSAFLGRYPWTTLTVEANFRKAFCLNRAGKFEAARSTLAIVLERYPTSALARQCAVELAYAEHQLGMLQDSIQTLRPVLAALTDDEKREESYALRVLNPNFVRPAVDSTVAPSASLDNIRRLMADLKAGQPQAAARLDEAIDGRASFLDIARLYAEGDVSSPAWGMIAAKMARIALHVGDLDRAREAADKAIQAGGGAHPDRVREVLARLQARDLVTPNLVGVILPLTGRFSKVGEQLQQGINLALGPTEDVKLLVRDSQGEPELAVAAVEELARDGVIAILGPVGTAEALPAAVRAQELGVPMISLSRAEGVTDAGPFVFRNMLTNSAQGRVLALYAANVLGARHAAVLAPDIPNAEEVVGPFWQDFESRGGAISAYETYEQDQTTFSEPLSRLISHEADKSQFKDEIDRINATVKSTYRRHRMIQKLLRNAPPIIDFDVLLIPDWWKSVLQSAPAIAAEDVITNGCNPQEMDRIRKTTRRDDIKTVTLLGIGSWHSPELIARGSKYVECSVIVDGFFAGSDREPTRKFVEDFHARYGTGQEPGVLQAQAYDTVGMVREIVTHHPNLTRDGFRQALGSLHGFPGATGETTFAANREADKPLFFLMFEKGGLRELPVRISPEGVAAPSAPPAKP